MSVSLQSIFREVKQISTVEVARRYLPELEIRQRGRHYVGRCPFHQDKMPSFIIFPDGGWKCFGCQESGDSVALVAKALNLRPLEAARQIARDFGLPVDSQPISPEAKKKVIELARERELRGQFKDWRDRTIFGLSMVLRACERVLSAGPTSSGYEAACNMEPYITYLLEVLNGSEEDQVELFREFGWGWAI